MSNNTQNTTHTLIHNTVKMGTSDAIGYTDSDLSVDLRTNKLKVQTAISVGNDQQIAIDTLLPVTVSKMFDSGAVSKTLHLPVTQLLALASNGLFELFNTNPKDAKQFNELCEALTNGYCYPSSYAQSLKKEPFSWATFIGELNADRDSGTLTTEQKAQYLAAQGKAPKIKELSAFLVLAYDSPKWAWLQERMDAAGYSVTVVADDMGDLL